MRHIRRPTGLTANLGNCFSASRQQHSNMRKRLIDAGIVLGAGGSYYLGSILGLLLRLPPATPSVIWPPNSLLTSALLLVPTRRWHLVLIPVLVAHLAVQLQTEWPLLLVMLLFLTNSAEAIMTAGGLRLLSDAPTSFDTPRRLSILVMVIVGATALSSFADAAAVHWLVGEPYWTVWRNRLFSNILAQLTFVPAVVGVATGLPRWIRGMSWIRVAEASVLAAGLLVMGLSGFTNQLTQFPPVRTVSSQNPLALQLPFLLWAAVRFGTTGAGVTLLTTTLLAVWSAVHGRGPFALMSPSITGPALTLSLIVVSATVLALAALIQERRDTQHVLAERLRFEELLARLSGAFVHVPGDRMDAAFDEWLGRLGVFLKLSFVRLYTQAGGELKVSYSWAPPKRARAATVRRQARLPMDVGAIAPAGADYRLHRRRPSPTGDDGPAVDAETGIQGHAGAAARCRTSRAGGAQLRIGHRAPVAA